MLRTLPLSIFMTVFSVNIFCHYANNQDINNNNIQCRNSHGELKDCGDDSSSVEVFVDSTYRDSTTAPYAQR